MSRSDFFSYLSSRVQRLSLGLVSHTCTHCRPILFELATLVNTVVITKPLKCCHSYQSMEVSPFGVTGALAAEAVERQASLFGQDLVPIQALSMAVNSATGRLYRLDRAVERTVQV